MLTMRRRGKNKIFYIRGSVSLGAKRIDVSEYSTGTSDEDAAAFLKNEQENDLRHQLMFGPKAAVAKATVAEAFDAYLCKPKPPCSSDVLRIGKMNEEVGYLGLADPHKAWNTFRDKNLLNHAPAGQDRYRSLFQAAVNVYHAKKDIAPIKIKAISFKNERVRFLDRDDAENLIRCYTPHVRPIIILYAFQGPRTQEGLQLQWGVTGVDIKRRTIWFNRTKGGLNGSVPMHPRVYEALLSLWKARGEPTQGHVFLNRKGQPYKDTRFSKVQGGNPLSKAHATACNRAGIKDFTIHDWRHHWASHCVMSGIDLETIRSLGGWESLRMVERYASVSKEHMRVELSKL